MTTVILVFGGYGQVIAQTAQPRIDSLHPHGGQRGKEVIVTFEGVNIGFGTRLIIEGSDITVDKMTPKLAPVKNASSKLIVHLTILPNAVPGLRKVRVITPIGASDIGLFDVGQWSEIEEKEPNNTKMEAQEIVFPATVIGKIDPAEDVDWFKFHAEKGHQFIFEVMAARQGSALDSVLSIQDKDGRELAFNDDFNGSDSLIAFTPQKTDDFYISLRDLRYQGSAQHTYRLTMGEIPYVTSCFPAGGPAGSSQNIALNGFNLSAPTGIVKLPMGEYDNPITMPVSLSNGLTNSVPLSVDDLPSQLEIEPNDSLKTAQLLQVRSIVYGRIYLKDGAGSDLDYYKFHGEQNQKLILEVLAQRLGSRLDSMLTIFDANGKELVSNDDAVGKDSRLEFTPPQTGDYIAQIRDMTQKQGLDYTYQFSIRPGKPDFTISYIPDHPVVGQGGTIPIEITATRLNGYDGDISLTLTDLPTGLSIIGTPIIPKGASVINLALAAKADSAIQSAELKLAGTANVGNKPIHHNGLPQSVQFTKDGDKLNRSISPSALPVISVSAPPEFTIAAPVTTLSLAQGKSIDLVVKVIRREGFTAKIPISLIGLPAGISAAGADIPEKASEVKLTLKADDKAAAAKVNILIIGQLGVDELHPTPQCSMPILLTVEAAAKK